jgi:hypothetical protein
VAEAAPLRVFCFSTRAGASSAARWRLRRRSRGQERSSARRHSLCGCWTASPGRWRLLAAAAENLLWLRPRPRPLNGLSWFGAHRAREVARPRAPPRLGRRPSPSAGCTPPSPALVRACSFPRPCVLQPLASRYDGAPSRRAPGLSCSCPPLASADSCCSAVPLPRPVRSPCVRPLAVASAPVTPAPLATKVRLRGLPCPASSPRARSRPPGPASLALSGPAVRSQATLACALSLP